MMDVLFCSLRFLWGRKNEESVGMMQWVGLFSFLFRLMYIQGANRNGTTTPGINSFLFLIPMVGEDAAFDAAFELFLRFHIPIDNYYNLLVITSNSAATLHVYVSLSDRGGVTQREVLLISKMLFK